MHHTLDDNIPFAIGHNLIVDIPIDPQGYADVYINDTTGLIVNLPGTMNADRLEAPIPLAIKVTAQPNDANEPIPRKKMIPKDELTVEGELSETKTILGWYFNFRTLTVTLPMHKHIAWSWEIKLMIQVRKTTKRMLELTIGCIGHVSFVISWVYHLLSHLRSLLARAWNRRVITIDQKCAKDLELMQLILDKENNETNMNLLAFRTPDRVYYYDSCPAGLKDNSNQGNAWQFKVPDKLKFQATNNLLKFLAAVITPWIDIVKGRLNQGDCALSMTDSTTAERWMKKSNFIKPNDNPIQATTCVDVARHYDYLRMRM